MIGFWHTKIDGGPSVYGRFFPFIKSSDGLLFGAFETLSVSVHT